MEELEELKADIMKAFRAADYLYSSGLLPINEFDIVCKRIRQQKEDWEIEITTEDRNKFVAKIIIEPRSQNHSK